MNADILRQAMAMGPVGKAELTHQVGDPSLFQVRLNDRGGVGCDSSN